MIRKNEERTLQTTETSLSIIQVIHDANGEAFSNLRSALGLSKSTLYYHLNTLEKHGYVVKKNGKYHLGYRFVLHAGQVKRREPGFEIVQRHSQSLANRIPEGVEFCIEENGRLIVVYHDIGGDALTDFEIGQYFYMHTTASGKPLLAAMPEHRVETIVERWGLPQRTSNTIVEETSLLDELERIRERGYSINDEEQRNGLRSVSATIANPDGGILGALAIDGATYRLTVDRIETEAAEELLGVVDNIETELAQLLG